MGPNTKQHKFITILATISTTKSENPNARVDVKKVQMTAAYMA